jgi:23S rRNA (guanine1835-N2)-methyltransferase
MNLSELKRYPVLKNEVLRAWDAADELILAHLSKLDLEEKRILIIGDSFGALAGSLTQYEVTSYTDSFVSAKGAEINTNGAVKAISDFTKLSGVYDYVLIRIPKNMSYFEDVLCRITPYLAPTSKLVCGVMVKHQSRSSFDLIGKIIGETSTSLAEKKARLIFANFEKTVVETPYPLRVRLDGFEKEFVHHSILFSRERLDIGTRFLLENMPKGDFRSVLDLGCANGVIGIRAKQLYPNAKIIFTDESAMAIESARTNYSNYFEDEAEYHWTNGFEEGEPGSVDLALINPPFHQGNAVANHIAWQMFTDAHQALKKGGLVRVIGNAHLLYPATLKRIFGNSRVIAKNAKFVICDANR